LTEDPRGAPADDRRGEIASPARRLLRAAVGLVAPLGLAVGLVVVVPVGAYLWMRAVHLVAVACWVGGMLVLPPLFARHIRVASGPAADLLGEIEHRVMRHLVNPAMVVTWGVGGWLLWNGGWWSSGWFHAKLALVIVLSGLHGMLSAEIRRLAQGSPRYARFYIPLGVIGGILAVGTVLLAVVKPL